MPPVDDRIRPVASFLTKDFVQEILAFHGSLKTRSTLFSSFHLAPEIEVRVFGSRGGDEPALGITGMTCTGEAPMPKMSKISSHFFSVRRRCPSS